MYSCAAIMMYCFGTDVAPKQSQKEVPVKKDSIQPTDGYHHATPTNKPFSSPKPCRMARSGT